MPRKTKECKECGGIMRLDGREWECNNCMKKITKRSYEHKKSESSELTKAQQKTIDHIMETALRHESLGGRQQIEVKKFSVEPPGMKTSGDMKFYSNLATLKFEVGMVGDEGTMAEYATRLSGWCHIGPGGRIASAYVRSGGRSVEKKYMYQFIGSHPKKVYK